MQILFIYLFFLKYLIKRCLLLVTHISLLQAGLKASSVIPIPDSIYKYISLHDPFESNPGIFYESVLKQILHTGQVCLDLYCFKISNDIPYLQLNKCCKNIIISLIYKNISICRDFDIIRYTHGICIVLFAICECT